MSFGQINHRFQSVRNVLCSLWHGMSLFFATLIATLALTGCEKSADAPQPPPIESSSAKANHQKQIALVMKTMSNPFFIDMEKGARQAEKDLKLHLVVRSASSETSIEQQIQLIETLIQEKVDAIVIAPGDSQRLVPVLKKAQMSGIKLVNIDNQLNTEAMSNARMDPVPFISVDNEQASYDAVLLATKGIKRPTKAAILEGIRSAENASSRLRGARRAFTENPNITVVASETANWKIDEAYQVTARLFTAHPDIGILFCANDMMALGAMRYLHEREKRGVIIASYDALDEVRDAIRDGKITVSVDQQASQQGYQGIVLANKMLQGENVPSLVRIEAHPITAAQLH